MMVGLGVCKLHFPAVLAKVASSDFLPGGGTTGDQKVEHGKTVVLHFFYSPLLVSWGMAVSFTKSQSQLQQPSLFAPSHELALEL